MAPGREDKVDNETLFAKALRYEEMARKEFDPAKKALYESMAAMLRIANDVDNARRKKEARSMNPYTFM